MAIFEKLRAELVDIIEWVDDSQHTLVWRFPRYHNQIKNGAQLIVRPGQIGRVRAPGPDRRRVRARPAPARDEQPADALDAGGLASRLRQPVQGRGLLRQHAPDHGSEVGHRQSGADARPRLRPRARARLRHLHAARDRSHEAAHRAGRHRRRLRGRRDPRAAALDHLEAFADVVAKSGIGVLDLAANYGALSEKLRATSSRGSTTSTGSRSRSS